MQYKLSWRFAPNGRVRRQLILDEPDYRYESETVESMMRTHGFDIAKTRLNVSRQPLLVVEQNDDVDNIDVTQLPSKIVKLATQVIPQLGFSDWCCVVEHQSDNEYWFADVDISVDAGEPVEMERLNALLQFAPTSLTLDCDGVSMHFIFSKNEV